MESLASYKNNGSGGWKGRILSTCGNHQIENPAWLCLEKAAGRDDDMDSQVVSCNRVVPSLGSKLWGQRKVSIHLT